MKFFKKSTLTSGIIFLAAATQIEAYDDFLMEFEKSIFPSSWCIDSWFIEGDLLYLQAFEDGVSDPWIPTRTIIDDSSSNCSGALTKVRGLGKEPHFRWDFGYRIGAGIDFQDCKWRMAAFWTHYSPNKTKHSDHAPRWQLDYDTIDVLVGYKCEFNHCFTLDAYAGIRAAKIDTKADGKFENVTSYSDYSDYVDISFLEGKDKQSFQGIGAFFGIRGDFDLGCGFSLYGEGDTGTLFGRNRLHTHVKERENSSHTNVFFYKRHQTACTYFVDGTAGIRWSTCLCNNMKITLKLGLENHLYFDFNKVGDQGNLSVNGGTFSAAVTF